MINMIQYLEKNPSLLPLLKENKASLIGVTELEQQAIIASFDQNETGLENGFWF